jgi:hypothetical protein
MHFSLHLHKRLAAVISGCLVILCLLGLLSSTPDVQAKTSLSQQRSSYFSVEVGSDTYNFTAPKAPTYSYEPYYGEGNYLAQVDIPLMTAYLHGKKFGTAQGSISTVHTLTEFSSTVSLAITGFGGISTGPGIVKTTQWYPKEDLLGGRPNCALAGPVAESQLGQTEGKVRCTSDGTSHIYGSTVDPVNRTQHFFYSPTNPVYEGFGASLNNVYTAIHAITNGEGQQAVVSSRAVVGNAMSLALTSAQKKGLATVLGGSVLVVLGNLVKNYCAPGDTNCAKQYHWLALLGGAIADIGNGIVTGGTLVFGVIPGLQAIADRVNQAVPANIVNNYLNYYPRLNAQQVADIENQIGENVPRLQLHGHND